MEAGHQNVLTLLWNRTRSWLTKRRSGPRLYIGHSARGSLLTPSNVSIASRARTGHIAVLGKTGSGKTSLLRYLCAQDITHGHGFAFFDLHGDTTPYLLSLVAAEEKRLRRSLSNRLILIDPSDRNFSVGLNILDSGDEQNRFVEIAETVQILKHRWHLDALGVRTEELLRHSLYVLSHNRLTLLEIAALLTSAPFRQACIATTPPSEARGYFETRYNRLSEPMQTVYREAILNKISVYAADPHFRHLLGQTTSTVNLRQAVDSGAWVIFNLEKGRLGEEAATLGALLLAKLKHALLGRRTGRLFTLYCDELQNLVAYDAAIDVLLSEARKFGVSVVSANQYLDQYPLTMRSAVLAMGSHALFQLSGYDAERVAHWLGGGRAIADRLRNLPQRHALFRSAEHPLTEIIAPHLAESRANPLDLLARVRSKWTRRREDVEVEILARQAMPAVRKNDLDDAWQ